MLQASSSNASESACSIVLSVAVLGFTFEGGSEVAIIAAGARTYIATLNHP